MTSAAEPAKACRRYLKPFSLTEGVRLSDATPFGRSATIVWDRRHIPNRSDRKPYCLQGAQSRFTARARPLDLDLESAHAMFHGLTTGILGGHLGSIGCRFARTLEPLAAGRRPRDRITLRIGDRDHRIIKSRIHMRCALGDVLIAFPRLPFMRPNLFLLAGNWSSRPLTRPRIRMRSLPANRQTLAMA
jgi:hypothetical protein